MALLGADGAVPGLGNVDPAGYVRLWSLAREGDWSAAAAEQARLERLFQIVDVAKDRSGDAGGIGVFKLALAILGIIDSPAMPAPMQTLGGPETAAVARILADVGLS
jgi:4-hydroxy-tetrahydrodipicolinate synthase